MKKILNRKITTHYTFLRKMTRTTVQFALSHLHVIHEREIDEKYTFDM